MSIEELEIEIQKVLVKEDVLYVEVDGVRIFENLNKIKMGAV